MGAETKRFAMFSWKGLLILIVLGVSGTIGYRQWGWRLTTKPAEFRLPFTGIVKARMRTENVTVRRKADPSLVFPMQVYYDGHGHLIHAEFAKPGEPDYRLPIEQLEDKLEHTLEKQMGVPTQPLEIDLSTILEKTGLDLEKAIRIEVNYVKVSEGGRPPNPCVIVNIYGVYSMVNYRGPDTAEFLRVRIMLQPDGAMIGGDTSI